MKPGSDDDDEVFREAMRGVKPLAGTPRSPAGPRPPAPGARFTRSGAREAPGESPGGDADITPGARGDAMTFSRPGVPAATLRRLRRGQFRVQAQLDLHGLTVRQARPVLCEFLDEALARGNRCVRIIHGKGLRSGPAGPVLKQTVSATLRRHASVAAFTTARQVDGGAGAVYVLLSHSSPSVPGP